MTWRDHIKVHPAADLFPMMSDEELKALGEDIKKNGQQTAIQFLITENGMVLLDGRNRLEAIERFIKTPAPQMANKSEIVFTNKDGVLIIDDTYLKCAHFCEKHQPIDPWAYVISANLHRRHLTTEQRRELVAKLIAAQPDKSDRQIAKQAKVSPTTVGTQRAKLEAAGDVSKLDTRTDTQGRQQPAHKSSATPQQSAEKRKAVYEGLADGTIGDSCLMPEDPENFRSAFFLRAEQAKNFAFYGDSFPEPTDDMIEYARSVARSWEMLATKLAKHRYGPDAQFKWFAAEAAR